MLLRIDDFGASSKIFNVYSNKKLKIYRNLSINFGNFLFLKFLRPFKAWAPYEEITPQKLIELLDCLKETNNFAVFSVTASWVTLSGRIIPFPEKFPVHSKILKQAEENGIIEIANHGLTHCDNRYFRHVPKLFRSNRKYHREFGPQIPRKIQETHIKHSNEIFLRWLGKVPRIFVPPGNQFTPETVEICKENGIEYINCQILDFTENNDEKITKLNNDGVVALHDKDLDDKDFFTKFIQELKLNQNRFMNFNEFIMDKYQ